MNTVGVCCLNASMCVIVCVCSKCVVLFTEVVECHYRNGGCLQYCRDLPRGAGVQCGCADGFELESDGRSCSQTGGALERKKLQYCTQYDTLYCTVLLILALYTTCSKWYAYTSLLPNTKRRLKLVPKQMRCLSDNTRSQTVTSG